MRESAKDQNVAAGFNHRPARRRDGKPRLRRRWQQYCIIYLYILDTSGPEVDAQRPSATGGDECGNPKIIILVDSARFRAPKPTGALS